MTTTRQGRLVSSFMAAGIVARARRALDAFTKYRRAPSTRNTHYLSTSIRRLLVSDELLREFYSSRLMKKKPMRAIKRLRKKIAAARDTQETGSKFLGLHIDSPFARAYAQEMLDVEKAVCGKVRKAVKGIALKPLRKLTELSRAKRLCSVEPAKSLDILLAEKLYYVVELRPSAIEGGNDAALHVMRLRYKKFRYAVELFSPDFTEADEKHLAYLKTLQDAMGEAHDWNVLEANLKRFSENHALPGVHETLSIIHKCNFESHAAARKYVSEQLEALRDRYI